MNYETARKLKEAGFPQLGDGFALLAHDDNPEGTMSRIPWCQYVYHPDSSREVMYAPTLEELIEACGKEFATLKRDRRPQTQVRYQANDAGWFPTPSEAVAALYLAIHSPAKDQSGTMES